MPRLFVFAIGGTGARVLKSLTMLLASGLTPSNYDIIPVIIDPHKDLKELNDCKALLKLYGDIHTEVQKDVQSEDAGFFKTRITTLTALAPGAGMKDEYDFDERHDQPFSQFLELEELPRNSPTRDFMSLLYSKENFTKPLSVGFKGSPNVGSVVLNALKDSPGFKAFQSVFGKDDKIFIISSIFGGTGAAGFPLLLKNLRLHSNATIRDTQIGALSIMPYFKLTSPDAASDGTVSDIDSNNFLSKTKAALTYYTRAEFSTLYNALYYIADVEAQSAPYENNEKVQANKAHLVEVLGALAVLHFADNTFTARGEVYEYGLQEDKSVIDFTNIADETRKYLAKDLSAFYFFQKLHKEIKGKDNLPFRKTNKFDLAFFNKDTLKNIDKFINEYYMQWLNDLEQNERSFNPFNKKIVKNGLNAAIKGYETEMKKTDGIFTTPFDISDLYLRMAKSEKKYRKYNEVNKTYQYLAMCRQATTESINANIDF